MAIDTIKSTAVLDGAITTADLANDIAINTSGAITTTGAFTSKGIDDNADATAITIDSLENVLVGTTSTDQSIAGHGFKPDGFAYHTRDGGAMLRLNRLNSNGDLMQIQKDGTTVGNIGVSGSDLYVGRDSCTLKYGNNELLPAYTGNGNVRNDAISLGSASGNFKDLYLSGGAYLGGTTSAHKFDDYEEGTWSPTLSFGGGTTGIVYGTQSAKYTKIGNVVNFSFRMYLTNKGSSTGHARVNGLPFTIGGMPTGGVFTLLPARGRIGASSRPMFVYIYNGDSSMLIYRCDWDNSINAAASDAHFSNNSEVELVGQYTTNS